MIGYNASWAVILMSRTGDFDVDDRHGGGKEKIFEDTELEVLLAEELYQT